MIVQMNGCKVDFFRRVCCQTCELYESGELFIPTNVSLDEGMGPMDNGDYDDDYYNNPIVEYDDGADQVPRYHGDDYTDEDAPEPVDGDLNSENGQTREGSQTPIIVASGIGLEPKRKASRNSAIPDRVSHNQTGEDT